MTEIYCNEMAHCLAHSATDAVRIPVDKKVTLKESRKPDRNHEEQKRSLPVAERGKTPKEFGFGAPR